MRKKKKKTTKLDNEVEFIELTVPFSRHIGRTKAWKSIIKSVTGDGAEQDVEIGNHGIDWTAVSVRGCFSAQRTLTPHGRFSDVCRITQAALFGEINMSYFCLPPRSFHMGKSSGTKKVTSSIFLGLKFWDGLLGQTSPAGGAKAIVQLSGPKGRGASG